MATKTKKMSSSRTSGNALNWTLAPAPESTDHIKINAQYEFFINCEWKRP